jgi:HEAT repeat protein
MMLDWLRKLKRPKQPEAQPPEQQFTLNPNTPEKQEPIIVRGQYWKNTAETEREITPLQDVVPDGRTEDLIKMLGRIERAEIRRSAAETLGVRGRAATQAIPALVLAAVDADKSVRKAALNALEKIDPAWPKNPKTLEVIPSLVLALKSHSSQVPEAASRLLVLIGPSAVPDLVEALATKEDTIDKIYAIRVLARYGPDAAGAVPELSRALGSQNFQERLAAADALLKIGPSAVDALPALTVGLSDPFSDGRLAMVACLANLGAAAEPSAPALVLLLGDKEDRVRQAAAAALVKIGPKSIRVLIEFLQMRDLRWLNARNAFEENISIWAMKPEPDTMVTDRRKAWRNLSWWFSDLFGDLNRLAYAESAAIAVLGKFASAAEAATPTITKALADPNPSTKLAAVHTLGQIGPKASSAIPDLIRLMADSDKSTLEAVQAALENIDANWRSDPAVPVLVATLAIRLSDPEISGKLAAQTLILIGAPAVPTLIDALQNGNLLARENSALALGQIGKDAKEAIPALTEALEDENHRVQTEAAIALQRIHGKVASSD